MGKPSSHLNFYSWAFWVCHYQWSQDTWPYCSWGLAEIDCFIKQIWQCTSESRHSWLQWNTIFTQLPFHHCWSKCRSTSLSYMLHPAGILQHTIFVIAALLWPHFFLEVQKDLEVFDSMLPLLYVKVNMAIIYSIVGDCRSARRSGVWYSAKTFNAFNNRVTLWQPHYSSHF